MTPRHPLADDAIETLKELRSKALKARDLAELRLRDEDSLPRGPLPVLTRISGHEATATHLRIAIEALGGSVEEAGFETLAKEVAVASGGYRPLYAGSDTSCPGCHRSSWIVGRNSAECAYCHTALPLAPQTRKAA